LKAIKIFAASGPPHDIHYDKPNKTLLVSLAMGSVLTDIDDTAGNFERWGRLIEIAMELRPLRTQGAIDRASAALEPMAGRLSDVITKKVKVAVDWSFVNHPKWLAVLNYIEIIHRICDLSKEWLPLVAVIKENHPLLNILKEKVKIFSFAINPDSTVNESEFISNEYGVDFARVRYKNPASPEDICAEINLSNILNNKASNMELELKVELLVTPDRAMERLEKKKTEERHRKELEFRERAEANAERARRDQIDAMQEGNSIQRRILNKMW